MRKKEKYSFTNDIKNCGKSMFFQGSKINFIKW